MGDADQFSGPAISLLSEYDQDFLAVLLNFNSLSSYSLRLERQTDFISSSDSYWWLVAA